VGVTTFRCAPKFEKFAFCSQVVGFPRSFAVTPPIVMTSSKMLAKLWWKLNSFALALTARTFLVVA
jgi:hypothetical protein